MHVTRNRAFASLVFLTLCLAGAGFGQAKPGDGSPTQRLDVMKQKLETIRRSAASSASVLKEENKDDKAAKG